MFTRTAAPSRWFLFKHLAFLTILTGATASADAQLLYSFETDEEGFVASPFNGDHYISHNQFTGNATDGTGSLQIEIIGDIDGQGFGRNVQVVESIEGGNPATPQYNLINTIAADPSGYTLDFDVILDGSSFSGLDDAGTFFQVGLFTNSQNGTFNDQFGLLDVPANTTGTFPVSVPAESLFFGVDSEWFQLNFSNNGDSTQGGGGEGLIWYLDNIRFSEAQEVDEQLLFSFETPDDPGTPGINEQFEGWTDGFSGNTPHVRAITSGPDGVTDGSSALAVTAPGEFTWGSQFVLEAGEDPSLQPQVDMLIADFNSAETLAIDLTFPDSQSPNFPSFLTVTASLSDQDGTFYQEQVQAGNPDGAAGNTVTLLFDTDQFVAGTEVLSVDGLDAGTFFRLALATNSDEEVDFTIDNIRLLSTPSEGLDGDYNDDGTVDAADYTVWRDNLGAVAGTLPNDSVGGVIGSAQYDQWVANYGISSSTSNSTSTAVPEPSSILLGAISCLSMFGFARRR